MEAALGVYGHERNGSKGEVKLSKATNIAATIRDFDRNATCLDPVVIALCPTMGTS